PAEEAAPAKAVEPESGPVSQDDIDALFSGGVSPAEEAAPAKAVEPESGPVSQDDIDALFSGGVSPAEEAVPARAVEPESGPVSQDDIDFLLEAAADPMKPGREKLPEADATHLLSQEELNSLLREDQAVSESMEEEAERSNFITQQELDQLLLQASAKRSGGGKPATGVEDGIDGLSQDDIDRMLQGAGDVNETLVSGENPDDGEVISQDELDRLLQGVGDEEETVALKKAPDEEELISQEDIDRLLQGSGDEDEAEGFKEIPVKGDIITQQDIEQLLQGKGGGMDDPRAAHLAAVEADIISQDDIDHLLREVDGDVPDGGPKPSKAKTRKAVVSQEDIDLLLLESEVQEEIPPDAIPPALDQPVPEVTDKVILAESDEGESRKAVKTLHRPWYRSKYLPIAASVLLLVAAGGFLGFHLLKKTRPAMVEDVAPEVVSRPIPKPVEQPLVTKAKHTVELKDFVVFAPVDREDLTFVTTSIRIDFNKADFAEQVVRNKAYFRSVVYRKIRKVLASRNDDGSYETRLQEAVQKALNRVLREDAVGKVVLHDYKSI
ncbi:MAG: hypothetical protein ACOZF0_15030, partial [Thermodesulfobacteriota bacterium]